MKFLHLSDLHFGLKLYNYDLSEDQEYIQVNDYEMGRDYYQNDRRSI